MMILKQANFGVVELRGFQRLDNKKTEGKFAPRGLHILFLQLLLQSINS